ncbi:MAG: ABC transporter ATP-binding protein [Eubacteriales bacterium]
MISLRNICKVYKIGYGYVSALQNINIELENGGFLSIMGPSGSGKSTLLNIMGCLDTQTGGEYYLNGVHVAGLSDEKKAHLRNRTIGFIFQSFFLLPRLTALENVELPLIYKGVDPKSRRRQALESLRMVGLADRSMHLPGELSGGQRQRVAIARALINSPKLILADEPTGNLDTATGREIMELLNNLNRQGTTVVLITHEKEIADYARQTLMIRDGEIACR